jgi:hypothetical protein
MTMDVKMVAYEPRAFMHDATYQAMTDTDPDHAPDAGERYGETDVSELAPAMALPTLHAAEAHAEKSSPAPTSSQAKSDATEAGAPVAPTSARLKLIPKPDREVSKHPDGKFYCAWNGCAEASQGFNRRCEWR